VNSFKLFEFKRKLKIFSFVEGFFESHSRAIGGKKDKNKAEKINFLAN